MLFSLTDTGDMSSTKDKQVAAVKMPPHSIEAEQSVLGGLMLDNDAWDRVAEKVVEQDFYLRAHRFIFAAMSRLAEATQPIDIITVSEDLEANLKLDDVGGFAYLGEIAKNTPSAANILAYAEIVRERAVVRDMISVAHDIADAGYDTQGRSSAELLDFAETKVFKIAEQRTNANEGPEPINSILAKTIEKIDELFRSPYDGVTGVSTGYVDLDKMTNGMQPSDLIIVAARPSMGKTTFAMNLCEHAAITSDKPVLIFSLEMPSEQIMMRMLASLGRIDQTKVRTGQLEDEDWARLSSAIELLNTKGKMYIDDGSGLTPTEVRSRARRVAREHGGLSMIMVDYLQLMTVPGMSENRTLEIAEISRSLKALAKELKVPVVALSQLNRSLE
ncbi:replicative DNA helicase, partial [Rheinheimera baltica]|uniref:replicative DNA helicase n=1 Tax=Rheinheimera baltica TaxID=67576 RepID=UPI00274003BF